MTSWNGSGGHPSVNHVSINPRQTNAIFFERNHVFFSKIKWCIVFYVISSLFFLCPSLCVLGLEWLEANSWFIFNISATVSVIAFECQLNSLNRNKSHCHCHGFNDTKHISSFFFLFSNFPNLTESQIVNIIARNNRS